MSEDAIAYAERTVGDVERHVEGGATAAYVLRHLLGAIAELEGAIRSERASVAAAERERDEAKEKAEYLALALPDERSRADRSWRFGLMWHARAMEMVLRHGPKGPPTEVRHPNCDVKSHRAGWKLCNVCEDFNAPSPNRDLATDARLAAVRALAEEWNAMTDEMVAKNVTGEIMLKTVKERARELLSALASDAGKDPAR